ncbi:MAG TPA: hypothetical protein VKB07_04415 [Gaiellaceae bacterium]|nr:hypothetical protein [Gaiellaceae bacterium]
MSVRSEPRTRPERRSEPELDAEQEIDVGRYWRALQARWWLPLAGLVIGAVLGYIAAVGGGDVYRAETTLYLGQPFSPTGNAPVQGLGTNPTIVSQIARSEASLKAAAAKCGTRVGRLRGKVSTQTVTASGARGRVVPGQNPLVELAVQGDRARVAECAANSLSDDVVGRVSSYVDVKIRSLNRRLEVLNDQLGSLGRKIGAQDRALNQPGLTPLEQLVLVSQTENAEQRRGIVEEERQEVTQQVALAQEVERARVVEQAGAVKTTARSPQNSAVVGGIIGLLLGAIVAVAWPAVAARRRLA